MKTENMQHQTKVVNIINFHGITLWVVESNGVEYVAAKPLSDLAKVDWRSAKNTFQQEENAVLYGSEWLNHPYFAGQGGTSTPSTAEKGLYIRLDRASMYLARINIRHMKAKGSIDAAANLLALQIEWAGVLHKYDSGATIKRRDRRDDRSQLVGLIKVRELCKDQGEKRALTALIHEIMADVGCEVVSVPDRQLDLLDAEK